MPYKQVKECDLCHKHDENCYEFIKVIVTTPRTPQYESQYVFHPILICGDCQQNRVIAELRAIWESIK